MKTPNGQALKIGDTILTVYHDVRVVGVISGYDGSGCVYVDFPAPLPQPVVLNIPRDGICLHYHDIPYTTAFLVSRPAELPEIFEAPATCIGGAYVRKAAMPLPTLADIEAAGKAAVARRDTTGAAVLRTVYRAIRDASAPVAA